MTPKRFCNRKPHFKAQPWMRNAEVIQAKPTARWFQRSTGTWAACRMYSPKTTELDPAQPTNAGKVKRECSVSRETCTLIGWAREEKGKTYRAGRHSR